jgi:hypothetical protein
MTKADTTGKTVFKAVFHVICDNKNSYSKFSMTFIPENDEFCSLIIKNFQVKTPIGNPH